HVRAGQDAQADRRQAVGRHQQCAEGSRVAREMEDAGLRPDRLDAGRVRQAPEGRSRLLEADDRVHRREAGVALLSRLTSTARDKNRPVTLEFEAGSGPCTFRYSPAWSPCIYSW